MVQEISRIEAAERLKKTSPCSVLSARQHLQLMDDISLAVGYMGGDSDAFEKIVGEVLDQHGKITSEGAEHLSSLAYSLALDTPKAAYALARLILSIPGVNWPAP